MKKIEKYYNLISSKYDEATSSFGWIVPNTIKNILDQYNLIKKDLNILDIGIGTGQTVDFLKDKECKLYGIDISSEMVNLAKKKYLKVKFFEYDINEGIIKLFKKNKFDLIISGGVFEFIKNIEIVFNDTYQLLKKDGHFVFTYEMLISGNKYQKNKEQYITEGYTDNKDKDAEFRLYRRSKKEIDDLILKTGFKKIKHIKVKAYLKTAKRIPVYYGIVLVKKI